MYPSHHHQPKRRKKRPIHGIKTVDVTRGKSGYGFTISGQHPCVLSSIVSGSPAERVGLRPGDYLVNVSGIDVSKLGHDEVVRMVGTSTGTLAIQVAENYNSSDSSDDDEYTHRTKTKYPARTKRHSRGYVEKMDRLLADINQRDRYCPDGHSHDPNVRPIYKNNGAKADAMKARSSRPWLHTPVGAENHEIQADGLSYIEAGASNVFKVPFQKSVSASNVPSASSALKHHRVEPKQAFIKSTSQSHFKSTGASVGPSQFRHFGNGHSHTYDNFSPNSLQQIINHSLHSYSAANEAFILNEDEFDDEGDDDQLPVQPDGGETKIIVGYIGSLETPGDANQPHIRIQSIRNAVRRFRVVQKIHTLVLMVVSRSGVRLVNMEGKEIAFYAVARLAFSGVCPDDKRFFGIVTFHNVHSDSGSEGERVEEATGSSCHVFMVDNEMAAHNMHSQKAKSFNIECTVDPHTQRCQEFPRSTTPIILAISNLYEGRPGGSIENDMARSQVFANPNRPVEHARISSSSSNNSNSDSGLGLCRDDGVEHAVVVDMPPPPIPAREPRMPPEREPRLPLERKPRMPPERPPQLPQIQWSGSTVHLTEGPIKTLSQGARDKNKVTHKKAKQGPEKDFMNVQHNTSVNSDDVNTSDKLNLRAMPHPSPTKGRLSADGLEHQNTAENLRLGMQKLLQARQRHAGVEQTGSDTESRSSHSDSGLRSTGNLRERPMSAPFNYLSNPDLTPSFSDSSTVKHDSDSSLMDKLSPRAFLSSAFTPVGSVGSAFRTIKSRPLMQQLRSPSAPPIPSYHGDDEDSDEDGVNGLISRFNKDKYLGLMDGGESKSKKAKKRDQDRKGTSTATLGGGSPDVITKSVTSNTDKWKNGQAGSLRKKSARRNPLSLSHESLVVLDQDPIQQKLSSANSVNSIVNHVAHSIEEDQVGRVAGWAVNLDKLLRDAIGIHTFTEFLKKEYSAENIKFWKACEDFKTITDSDFRKSKAKEINDTHVDVLAQESVNIDSVARKQVESQLDNPTTQIFCVAQQQIWQLMKQDSYPRFLKSEDYKTLLMREMEGKPIDAPDGDSKQKPGDKGNDKDGKKKDKNKEKEEHKDHKEKRRKSLLPWRPKSRKSVKGDAEVKPNKTKEKEKEKENEAVVKSTGTTTNSTDLTSGKRDAGHLEVPETITEEPEQPKFCRVIMPDGSTTVVGTKQGQTINYVLGKLCEKRGLSIATVDVFLLGSEKPLNLNDDISVLGSKEVTIERRVLFRMDLPNKKSIGVKAKPNRMIRDVFRPILNKYGFRIEAIDVHLSGQSETLNLDNLVSTIDSQRVVVLTSSTSADTPVRRNGIFGRYLPSSRPPLPNNLPTTLDFHGSNNNDPSINNNNATTVVDDPLSLDELTNEIFDSLMLNKSDQLLTPDNFDDLGILDPENSLKVENDDARPSLDSSIRARDSTPQEGAEIQGRRGSGKGGKTKQRVTFDLQKNTVRNRPSNEEAALCERLKRAQDLSLDDQRGLAPRDIEMPEFLRVGTSDQDSSAAENKRDLNSEKRDLSSEKRDLGSEKRDLNSEKRDLSSKKRDLSSQIDGYIENITENIAVYSRESTPNKRSASRTDGSADRHGVDFGSPIENIRSSDRSFSQDGVVPSYDDADSLFQISTPDNVDFDDPHLTDKSLTDIGFSQDHNKYLSRSRNFVNQRRKHGGHAGMIADIPKVSSEILSPDQTLRSDLFNQSDTQDSTLLHSPCLSSCSSDSSLDREHGGRHVSKSRLGHIKPNSRHTFIHSPNSTSDEDSFLSTVDTDGKMTLHSTPTVMPVVSVGRLSNAGRTPKILNSSSMSDLHSEEVTFV